MFQSEVIEIIDIPYQTPNANAYAERWARSVREEYLDRLIILSRHHLQQVLEEYVEYYNEHRPHQNFEQDRPVGLTLISTEVPIRHRDVLGSVIRNYYRKVA